MDQMPVLTTSRLTLRPLTAVDGDMLFPVFADTETMRYMPTRPHGRAAETTAAVARELEQGARYWTIRLTPDGAPIGYVGFLGQTRIPGMGYILQRAQWGKGMITEACTAVLDYAFQKWDLRQVECWIHEQNLPSRRVASKLGFSLQGRIAQKYPHSPDHHTMLVYGCWAADWAARREETAVGEPTRTPTPRIFRQQPVLVVPDLTATLDFYVNKLGFTIDFLYGDPPEHAGVGLGHWTGQGVLVQLAQGQPETPFSFTSWLYIFVDARIDELFVSLQAQGVTVLESPQDYPWGMREFAVMDNNGLQLRFGTQL